MIGVAPTGFPALRKLFRDDFPPLLRAVDPFLRNLNPILTGLDLYKHEFTSFFANVAAAANGELTTENAAGEKMPLPAGDEPARARNPWRPSPAASPPTATAPTARPCGRRASPPACRASTLASAAPGITATLNPETAKNEAFIKERTKKGDPKEAEDFFNRLKKFAFAEQTSTAAVPAPACTQQAPFNPIYGSGAGHRLPARVRTDGPAVGTTRVGR